MSSITVTNSTNTNIGLPGSFGMLLPHQSRTWTNVSVAEIERVAPSLIAMQTAGDITFDVFTPTTLTAAEADTTFSTVAGVQERANLVIEEFTNVATADADYFVTTLATAVTDTVVTTFAANGLPIPRSITISRTADVGAYTTDDITVDAVLNGEPITLTFTPADADGGDTIQSTEKIGVTDLRAVRLPAQVSTAGAFTVGFGAGIGLQHVVKTRAGLPNVVRQVAIGAVVTTGTVDTQLYTPAAAPNNTNDYALLYERV